jgi:DNA-binding CsgD family transcriptional regulator
MFIREFIQYYIHLKKYGIKCVKDTVSISKKVYEKLTKPFYERWSQLAFIEWNPGYAKHFYSFIILCGGTKILLPQRLLTYEVIQPENKILEQLKAAKTLDEFFDVLNGLLRHLNLPLLKNDVKIIEAFMNPFLRKKIRSVPTNRQLAEILNISENTISRRLDLLYQKTIISHIYRINIAKLGYQTVAIITDTINYPSKIEPYCLASIPIDLCKNIGRIHIFQVPFTKQHLWRQIRKQLNPKNSIMLTKSYIGYNLIGFSCNEKQRWNVLPPILLNGEWNENLVSEEMGMEYNHFNDMTILNISKTQAEMLNLIQSGTMTNVDLSNSLGVTQKYIKQFFDYFFDMKLIERFTILSHIGLDLKVCLILQGTQSVNTFKFLKNIANHLKFFPFSFLMYNETCLESGEDLLLVGLLRMPSSWITDFSDTWMKLSQNNFTPKLVINQGIVKWGIDIPYTYF